MILRRLTRAALGSASVLALFAGCSSTTGEDTVSGDQALTIPKCPTGYTAVCETCGPSEGCLKLPWCKGCTCQASAAPPPPPPTPVAPLSTTTTSSTPSLHWLLRSGVTGAQVDICRDRACTNVVTSFAATGTSAVVPTALAKGVYFWRLHNVGQTAASPVWEFTVRAGNAPSVNTSWGTMVDVNGDGLADVAVGAPGGGAVAAAVSIYLGTPNWAGAVPATVLTSPAGVIQFGESVASAGDVNGDGIADLVVGASTGAFLYLGSASGLQTAPAATLSAQSGTSVVASAGDVNGDGYADVIVGVPSANVAYVYLGGATLSGSVSPTWTLNGPAGSSSFGFSVASAGDIQGDGFADIVVGAPGTTGRTGLAGGGAAWHAHGSGRAVCCRGRRSPSRYPIRRTGALARTRSSDTPSRART